MSAIAPRRAVQRRALTSKERTELLVDALRRGTRVRWFGRSIAVVTLPGSGDSLLARPSEISGAYRRIVRELTA